MVKRIIAAMMATAMMVTCAGCSENTETEATAEPTEEVSETSTLDPTNEVASSSNPYVLDEIAELPGGVAYNFSSGWGQNGADATRPDMPETTDDIDFSQTFYTVAGDGVLGVVHVRVNDLDEDEAILWDASKPEFVRSIALPFGIDSMAELDNEVTAGTAYMGSGYKEVDGSPTVSIGISFVIEHDIYMFLMTAIHSDSKAISRMWDEMVSSVTYNGVPELVTPLEIGDITATFTGSAEALTATIATSTKDSFRN